MAHPPKTRAMEHPNHLMGLAEVKEEVVEAFLMGYLDLEVRNYDKLLIKHLETWFFIHIVLLLEKLLTNFQGKKQYTY